MGAFALDAIFNQFTVLLENDIEIEVVIVGSGTTDLAEDPTVSELLFVLEDLGRRELDRDVTEGEISGTLRHTLVKGKDAEELAQVWTETVDVLSDR